MLLVLYSHTSVQAKYGMSISAVEMLGLSLKTSMPVHGHVTINDPLENIHQQLYSETYVVIPDTFFCIYTIAISLQIMMSLTC